MTELLTAAQMREIEQDAISSGAVTGLELMERAGRGVVEAVFEAWPEMAVGTHRAVVLCGPGNNGGDGFVVARLIKEEGWEVEVYLYGDAQKLPPDAKTNYTRWCALGQVRPYVDAGPDAFRLDPAAWGSNDLIVDALFGTGLVRPVVGFDAFGWVTQMSGWPKGEDFTDGMYPDARVVAIDMPSGLCADSGRGLRIAGPDRDHEDIRAHLTVTFHSMKRGHVLGEGPAWCGKVVVKDIGLDASVQPPADGIVCLCAEPPHMPAKAGHKYDHGHALVLTGGAGRTGAARMAARGALRIGAGLVTLGVPPAAQFEVATHITALMLARVPDGDALTALLADDRINALCLGPGLGIDDDKAPLVAAALGSARQVVLDADALSLVAQSPALFDALHGSCVLTPHSGEFARLFPDIADKLTAVPDRGPAYSKVDATRAAAARCGTVVLFKGPDTVIAHPDGRAYVHGAVYDRAAPWLATAGAGDVLAGFITGLLARGFAPMQAAVAAAWLHVECARSFGPGLIAEDLPAELPEVFRALGV